MRVYLRLQVDDLAKLKRLEGCLVHLRAPDGRIWDEDLGYEASAVLGIPEVAASRDGRKPVIPTST